MRYTNCVVLTVPDVTQITIGSAIDSSQFVSPPTFAGTVSSSGITMQFIIQVSNDICTTGGNLAVDFTPTNWVDLNTLTITGSTNTTTNGTGSSVAYRWYRVKSKAATAGTGSMQVVMMAQSA